MTNEVIEKECPCSRPDPVGSNDPVGSKGGTMKLPFIFSILLLFTANLCAQEPGHPILFSKQGTLRLKTCDDNLTCSFSGTQTLTGTYRFGFSENCENDEKDGCVTLDFYPDNVSDFPHFEGSNIKSIDISNYKEGSQRLMGQTLSQKVIKSCKEAIKSHEPNHDFDETMAVKGSATVVVEAYNMGICCNSLWARARLVKVIKKSKPRIVTEK